MKEQVNMDQIKYSEVYLSDLDKVVLMYKNQKADLARDHQPITAQFGLPLALATNGREVVAFAAAIPDAGREVAIHCYYKTGVEAPCLEEKARSVFDTTFVNDEGHLQLNAAITRLISWLNSSY